VILLGIAGRLRPHRFVKEAQGKPNGKGASWRYNQLSHSKITTKYTKIAKFL